MTVKSIFASSVLAAAVALPAVSATAATYTVDQDVMTSPFYFGTDKVRGYDADNRPSHYVTADNPYGFGAPATIYLDFSSIDFSSFAGQEVKAMLSMESVKYSSYASGTADSPFKVSVHGVDANPFTSITDNTNPSGPVSWQGFYNTKIKAADSKAVTAVDCINCTVTFDVSALVNSWINGNDSLQYAAVTAATENPNSPIFHGFLNNSEAPGSTQLSVSAVPVPAAVWLFGSALAALVGIRSKAQKA